MSASDEDTETARGMGEIVAETAGEPEPIEPLAHFNPCDGDGSLEFEGFDSEPEPAWTFVEPDARAHELQERWITIARSDCKDRRAMR